MLRSVMPPSRRVALAAGAVAVALASPVLTSAPSYAGLACDTVPVPGDDCTAPTTEITSHPDSRTTATTADFTFAVTSEEPLGVTFECRLEGPGQTPTWTDCTDEAFAPTTGSASYTGLAVGDYQFSVRATDKALGTPNVEAAVKFPWEIVEDDTGTGSPGAPETTITSAPKRWNLAPFAGLEYDADEPLAAAHCTLNGTAKACDAGGVVLTGLGPGDFTFTVAGEDADGDTDPTPASTSWTIPLRIAGLTFSDGWKKKSGSGYYQDTYAVTTKKGATVKKGNRSFRSAVLVATRCQGCGKVEVTLGKKTLRTINLDAASTKKRQALPLGSWSADKGGMLTVTTLTKGKTVIVEGIGFSDRP